MYINELIEAFDFKRKDKGQVPFKSSAITDPHIMSVIRKIAAETGVHENTLRDEISNSRELKYYDEVKKYSPMLYDTIAKNAIENAAFNHIGESIKLKKIEFADVKFDWKIFKKLLTLIMQDNPKLWPLIAPGELKRIYKITPILVPSNNPELKKYNDVTTAAVDPGGNFIFCMPFMQQLINYAAASGVVPKGAKYISNGGTIPDSYAYIEFLILHEVFHYYFGDFSTGNRYSQYQHMAHNWAMDFRSNYILVKSGYEQLPMGLFSDDLNMDRESTKSYGQLIKAVDAEMQKLPEHLRQWINDKIDDHPKPPQQPPQPKKPRAVGDLVKVKSTGQVGKITSINSDGSFEVDTNIEQPS